MARIDTFTVRVSVSERRALAELARHWQRSQGDVVRLLVRSEAQKNGLWPAPPASACEGVQNARTA